MMPEEWDKLKALFHRAKNLGENVSAEMELFQVRKLASSMFTLFSLEYILCWCLGGMIS